MKIAVIVGSLSQASINKKLAKSLEEFMPSHVELVYADIDLPLFDYELEPEFPKKAQVLKDLIEGSDGVLLVSPEYNRSFSGVLKNAIDWASRPWGKNSFDGKPVGIIGASIGQLGTTQAQSHLRNVMIHLNAKVLGQPEMYINATTTIDQQGRVVEGSRELFENFAKTFVAHVKSS